MNIQDKDTNSIGVNLRVALFQAKCVYRQLQRHAVLLESSKDPLTSYHQQFLSSCLRDWAGFFWSMGTVCGNPMRRIRKRSLPCGGKSPEGNDQNVGASEGLSIPSKATVAEVSATQETVESLEVYKYL